MYFLKDIVLSCFDFVIEAVNRLKIYKKRVPRPWWIACCKGGIAPKLKPHKPAKKRKDVEFPLRSLLAARAATRIGWLSESWPVF